MAVHPDGSGLHTIAVLRTGSWCVCADWSPDGSKIAYEAGGTHPFTLTPELWVMNADGTGRVRLTHNAVVDENPDWSPDGKHIAFYTGRTGNQEIWIVDADGSHPRRVTHAAANARFPRWRP